MHDFAATHSHTILLNLPLTLAPGNLFSIPPIPLVHFDRSLPSEFVVFPRLLRSVQNAQEPIRYVEKEPCLIFHTANAWDTYKGDRIASINMLACRFKSAKLVYAAGAVEIPRPEKEAGIDDVVRLHYYSFKLPLDDADCGLRCPSHSFPLMAIPFEFPAMPHHLSMSSSRYIYGCTMRCGSFDERLGGAAKVDCLVKVDVKELVSRGCKGQNSLDEPADTRTTMQILKDSRDGAVGPIQVFALPEGYYAQEPRFVPRLGEGLDEDDGYLLTYGKCSLHVSVLNVVTVYDEHHLRADGMPSKDPGTGSELWVIDAKRMAQHMDAVVCRVKLPQRVPYGLHGTWIPPTLFRRQRSMVKPISQPLLQDKLEQSRVRQLISVLFDRPADRDRSRFERIVLAVLWPASFIVLLLALFEAARHSLEPAIKTQSSDRPSTKTSPLDHFPWPQVGMNSWCPGG